MRSKVALRIHQQSGRLRNTVLWNRGTAYALHDDIVMVDGVAGRDASQADPSTVTFRLCKLCNDADGAGV